MIPTSLAVLVMVLPLGALGFGAVLWAWRRGAFDKLNEQSRVIFEPRDLRMERPWESPGQRAERGDAYGEPEPAEPGEWGGG